jgi:hypothetical protein
MEINCQPLRGSEVNRARHRWALPSRVVAVLDGRGRLERATRCAAGKSARRFLAASSVSVIRVDLKSHRQ